MCLFTTILLSQHKCYCIAGNHKKIQNYLLRYSAHRFHHMAKLQKVHIW